MTSAFWGIGALLMVRRWVAPNPDMIRGMRNVLFVCSRNKLRSPTAESVFAGYDGIETDSAGLAPDADVRLSADQVQWADLIVVMEKAQRTKLTRQFSRQLAGKRIVCLDIPDRYTFMQPELVALLEKKMAPLL
jgi:predicted protein tyrosine phosphatase